MVVEGLARTRDQAVVQRQMHVIDGARRAWRNRSRGRELGACHLAVLGRCRDRVRGTAEARRHRERGRSGAGCRRNDLRIARDVDRAGWYGDVDHVVAAARAGDVAEIDVELVPAVRQRDLPLLGRVVEAGCRHGRAAARIQERERRARDRRARQRAVHDAIRVDRQVEARHRQVWRHHDVRDALQCVRERRCGDAERRGVRAGAGRPEAKLVLVAGRDVRRDADDLPGAGRVGQRGVDQIAVAIQLHRPAFQHALDGVLHVVEVGVVPGRPGQRGNAGDAADDDRDAGAQGLRRVVPVHDARVGHRRAVRQARGDRRPEAQHGGRARRHRTIGRGVVRRDERAGEADARVRTVQRGRARHVGEVTGLIRVEVVPDDHFECRDAADVHDGHDVLEHGSRRGWPAPDHRDLLDDRDLLAVAEHRDRRFRSRRGVAVAVGQEVGRPIARHRGLVADQGAGRRGGIHQQVELDDCGRAGRDRAGARTRQGRRQVGGADVDAGRERRHAGVRLSDRQAVQQRGVRDVGRIRRHRIGQRDRGRRDRPGVLHGDRVAERVPRIDHALRPAVAQEHHALLGVEQRQCADDVAGRVVCDRRVRIVGRVIDDAALERGHETLVADRRSFDDIRIHDHLERDGRHVRRIGRGVRRHRTRSRVDRRMDRHAVHERREASGIGDRRTVQRGAAGDVGRVRGHCVAERRIHRVVRSGVPDRDRVAQRVAGLQDVGIVREIVRCLPDHEECRRRDRQPGRVLVAGGQRVGDAVDVRVVGERVA